MNFKEFNTSLKYRKYKRWKIIIRFIEYKLKNFLIDILISLNVIKFNSKKIIDIGSFKDNSYINFFLYSLKDDYTLAYKNDENAKKLFKRIGILNFFKNTISNTFVKEKINIKINMRPVLDENDNINIDTNYFKYFYDETYENLNGKLIMPYYMYPRIYNSFYKNINTTKTPNFNLRVFFSGSVVKEGYGNFKWKKEPEKFLNRINIIDKLLKEFKSEIYLINSEEDIKTNKFLKKKIVFCLHDKMIKKTSYILNFKENFNLLSNSCFNLNCPGVVMPLCHHLVEGMKVGSIPITNCERLVYPNLSRENSLQYSNINELIVKINEALNMPNDQILDMRSNVLDYYNSHLSPAKFKSSFQQALKNREKKIICCDDHRSVENFN